MARKMKFPAKIFVYEMQDSDVAYLSAVKNIDEIPEDQHREQIATYELTRVETLKVNRTLEK